MFPLENPSEISKPGTILHCTAKLCGAWPFWESGDFKGSYISCKKLWFFWFGKAIYLYYAECDFIKSIHKEHKQLWITDSVSGVRACRLGLAVRVIQSSLPSFPLVSEVPTCGEQEPTAITCLCQSCHVGAVGSDRPCCPAAEISLSS